MSDSKRKPMSTTERQVALRKAGVGEEIIKEVGALGEMLCKETKMENDKRAERRYLDAGFYLFFGGGVGLVLGVAAHFIVVVMLGLTALFSGIACRFVGHRKQIERIRNQPTPPSDDNVNSETGGKVYVVCLSLEGQKVFEELGKWLGKDSREVIVMGVALLKTCKEAVEAGGKLCFHDKDGSVQEIDFSK